MSCFTRGIAGMLFLVAAAGSDAFAQERGSERADTAHFRNLCRQAAQTIRTGSPHSRVSTALAQLRVCGTEERQLIGRYWLDGMVEAGVSDSARLERTEALFGVQDRKLFDGALRLTQDGSLSLEQRTIAMAVLVSQLEPRMLLEVERLRSASPGHYCGAPVPVNHSEVVVDEALPVDAYAQAKSTMDAIIVTAGRETPIGAAAACVRLTLIAYSQADAP